MRYRAGVLLFCNEQNKVLLIYRKKNNREYWVVPGGGLLNNESYEEAAKREINEELGVEVLELKYLCTIKNEHVVEKYYISFCDYVANLTIKGEELQRSSEQNVYIPQWVEVNKLFNLNLLPVKLKDHIDEYLHSD